MIVAHEIIMELTVRIGLTIFAYLLGSIFIAISTYKFMDFPNPRTECLHNPNV